MSVWEDISIHSLLVARRCSMDVQPSVWSMSVTLDVL